MQVAVTVADAQRDDGQPLGICAAEHLDVRIARPAGQSALPQALLKDLDRLGADRLLEREHQACPDRLDNGRCAALFPGDWVVEVAVADRVDERDRAAAGHCRYLVTEDRKSTRLNSSH